MKLLLYPLLAIALLLMFSFTFFKKNTVPSTIYQFKALTIDGKELDFSQFKGKKLLIVNTASKCGFTPQFEQLEAMFKKYKDRNFEVIGFPSNDFKSQDPGTNDEIHSFCQRNYGVTFTMMAKVHVKGDSICDVYKWLTSKALNGQMNSTVKWNFQKYMIDETGMLVDYAASWKKPDSRKITRWIEGK